MVESEDNLVRCSASLLIAVRHRVQKVLFAERLAEKLDRTGLHGLDAHRHVGMGSDEDHRKIDAELSKLGLKLQPAHSRQPNVEDQAPRNIGTLAAQKVLGRAECFDRDIDGTQQRADAVAQTRVIVDDVGDGLVDLDFVLHRKKAPSVCMRVNHTETK